MASPARRHMTAEEFLDWAMARPAGARYELVAGEVVAMAPERASHGRAKVLFDGLRAAVAAAGLPCEAFIDGMAVRVDDATVYEPDVLLRCGLPVAGDCVEIGDPVIVVEVLSPSGRHKDTVGKLDDYFRLPSLRHYLIVKTADRTVIHHRRDDGGELQTRIMREGTIELRPPGLSVEVASLFPTERLMDGSPPAPTSVSLSRRRKLRHPRKVSGRIDTLSAMFHGLYSRHAGAPRCIRGDLKQPADCHDALMSGAMQGCRRVPDKSECGHGTRGECAPRATTRSLDVAEYPRLYGNYPGRTGPDLIHPDWVAKLVPKSDKSGFYDLVDRL